MAEGAVWAVIIVSSLAGLAVAVYQRSTRRVGPQQHQPGQMDRARVPRRDLDRLIAFYRASPNAVKVQVATTLDRPLLAVKRFVGSSPIASTTGVTCTNADQLLGTR